MLPLEEQKAIVVNARRKAFMGDIGRLRDKAFDRIQFAPTGILKELENGLEEFEQRVLEEQEKVKQDNTSNGPSQEEIQHLEDLKQVAVGLRQRLIAEYEKRQNQPQKKSDDENVPRLKPRR